MYSASAFLLSSTLLTPCIFAYAKSHGDALGRRQVTPSVSLSIPATSTSVVSSTKTTSPNEITEPFDIAINGQIYPPAVHIVDLNSTGTPNFAISCNDCSIAGNLSLSAGGRIIATDVIQPPPDVEEIPSDFNFKDHWVAATFDNFDAHFDFSVELNASSPNNEIVVPLPFAKTFSKTIGIVTLTATLTTMLHGWLNTNNDVNLTYGFDFSVPPGSEVIIDLSHIENSTSPGLNQTTLTPIPLNSTRSDLDIDFELSFRPSVAFAIAIDALVAGASLSLTVDLDVPKLDVNITQVHNVTSDCRPVPANSSTPADQIYQNLTLVAPSVGFETMEVFNESAYFLGVKLSGEQHFEQSRDFDLATDCLFYDAAKKSLGPATAVKAKVTRSLAVGRCAPFAVAFAGAFVVGFVVM